MANKINKLLGTLGPGILYAAVAIGVSHVVQSTRAGAVYGLAMIAILIVIGFVKYPAMRFGGQYAAATGKSLPENYFEQGWWAGLLYLASTLFGMWFALAAIGITTAGLVKTVFALEVDAVYLTGFLFGLTAVILIVGRYQWLERAGKVLVAFLAVMVVIATLLAVPRVNWQPANFVLTEFDASALFFIVAMAGWMPTPMEGATLNSVWTSARIREEGLRISPESSRIDFNVGYATALLLAVGFLILGVAVMHEPGIAPKLSPAGFADQVISLFTTTIGAWSFYLIGATAIAAMFSTLLTVLDGQPRQFIYVLRHFRGTEPPSWLLPVLIIMYSAGSFVILLTMLTTFARFIDFVTTIGFVMAPVFAILNHRAMMSSDVPEVYRAGAGLRLWSLGGIVSLSAASLAFFYLKLV